MLADGADESLVAVNPMRRVLFRKEPRNQQTVMQHEWTRMGGGRSRITEGYNVETTNVSSMAKKGFEGTFVTIYERRAR